MYNPGSGCEASTAAAAPPPPDVKHLPAVPAEVLHQILASLPASSVAAAAVTHPALAAAASALPELSHAYLCLTLQRDPSSQSETQGTMLRCRHRHCVSPAVEAVACDLCRLPLHDTTAWTRSCVLHHQLLMNALQAMSTPACREDPADTRAPTHPHRRTRCGPEGAHSSGQHLEHHHADAHGQSEGHGTTDFCISSADHAKTDSVQANVQSFFARPTAPAVRHLHIEARFDPGDTPRKTWTDPWRQITALRLAWLAPALRTARSLRLTVVELMALGYCVTPDAAFAALMATCGPALEVLHIDSTWRLNMYNMQW